MLETGNISKSAKMSCYLLEDEKCANSVKLNASKTILDYSLKVREQTEIIEKLNSIEKRINDD